MHKLFCFSLDCIDAYMGDGYCADRNNNEKCKYDEGDCCPPHLTTSWDIFCSECECLDPNVTSNSLFIVNILFSLWYHTKIILACASPEVFLPDGSCGLCEWPQGLNPNGLCVSCAAPDGIHPNGTCLTNGMVVKLRWVHTLCLFC